MASRSAVELERTLKVALIGNPNTGKSTLFNALCGGQSRVGNYPGVTVEKKIGMLHWPTRRVQLIDLPGTYSLAPRSLDEMVSVDVLLGRQADIGTPDVVVCIADASNLERNLYLVSQVLDVGLPVVVVLNMSDVAEGKGVKIDRAALASRLSVPVIATAAHRKLGIGELQQAIEQALAKGAPPCPEIFPEAFAAERKSLANELSPAGAPRLPDYLAERLLLDVGGYLEGHLAGHDPATLRELLQQARARLAAGNCRVPAIEARVRYAWIRKLLEGIVEIPPERPATLSDRIDGWLTHRVFGLLTFAVLMFVVFQSIYTWYEPLKQLCDSGLDQINHLIASLLAPGPLRSLLTDGVVAGVGGVLSFLPQIVLLFFFIALLEDCGYMARAAFLMDKLMTKVGLSGKSFVPLMSSFACAIPGVMAARVIENRRDRMVTILVAPLMSCSARLPVYVLLTSALLPPVSYLGGWITLRGLVLFAASSLGAVVAIPVAWLLKKTLFKGETPPFVMELPSYKWPSPWIVARRVFEQGKAFVTRAGTLIFATSVVIWGAGYFPGNHAEADRVQAEIEQAESRDSSDDGEAGAGTDRLVELQNSLKAALLEQSFLGRLGHWVEPAVRPLGWDWKVGIGVIASFPAREVIVSTLGTIYSLGNEVDEESPGLQSALQNATWPDGRKVYTVPVALSIMVFFALCAQCASTLLVIHRETNHWVWPAFTFVYMTALAYGGAYVTYQLARYWL